VTAVLANSKGGTIGDEAMRRTLAISGLLGGSILTVALLFPQAAQVQSWQATVGAQSKDKLGPYKLVTTISIPGDLTGFDISWVDSESGRYYLADSGNAAATPPVSPRIDVIDTEHDKFLYSIPLSTRPNGVLTIRKVGDDDEEDQPRTLVAGGADSTAIFIDLAHPFATPLAVSTGGNHRADELAYDPLDHIILIANDQDTPAPFVSFINTANPSFYLLGKIVYDGSLGNPHSTGGIEQPVWDGVTQRFYIAIPKTVANPKGEVDEINPTTMKVTRVFPTTCGPAGLVLIPGQRLMTSCGDVLAVETGAILTTVAGVGRDEIWFNVGDDRVYFGGGLDRISVPVVSGLSPYSLITTLTVGQILLPPPNAANHTTHSVAADRENNRIFVPVTHEGVKVYTNDRDNGEGPDN